MNLNNRFGYYFGNFVNLLSRADVILKIENTSEGKENIEHFTFNAFHSPGQYEASLSSLFEQFCINLEGSINNIYDKIEKLNLVTRHIVEVEALSFLVLTGSSNEISHRCFTFTIISEEENKPQVTRTIADVQNYLIVVHTYVSKISSYLTYLKENIEKTPQLEFLLPAHLIADPNTPTEECPLAYFEFLLRKQGILILKNAFRPSVDDFEYYGVSYDESTEIKRTPYQDQESGEWNIDEERFYDKLYQTLYFYFNKTIDVINVKIGKIEKKKKIKLYLKLIASRLRSLRSHLVTSASNEKYPFLLRAIDALIKYIFENYASFTPKPSKEISGILEKSLVYDVPKQPKRLQSELKGPGMFKWRDENGRPLTLGLHAKLTELKYIDTIDLPTFHEVFSGAQENGHFHIKWIDKTKNGLHTSKVSLLYLFKKLIENNLIEEQFDSKRLLTKVEFIFRDYKGDRLQHLCQSARNLPDKDTKGLQYIQDINAIVDYLAKQKLI